MKGMRRRDERVTMTVMGRRFSWDTYPESYITKYTSIRGKMYAVTGREGYHDSRRSEHGP